MSGPALLPTRRRRRRDGICREFPGEPGQVGCVRDFVARRLRAYGCPEETLGEVLVCVSEAATNAIKYTRSRLRDDDEYDGPPRRPEVSALEGLEGRFAVTVQVDVPTVRIEVADAGPAEQSVLDDEDDDFGRGGRGFLLVSALSEAMGYEETEFGGVTWFQRTWTPDEATSAEVDGGPSGRDEGASMTGPRRCGPGP